MQTRDNQKALPGNPYRALFLFPLPHFFFLLYICPHAKQPRNLASHQIPYAAGQNRYNLLWFSEPSNPTDSQRIVVEWLGGISDGHDPAYGILQPNRKARSTMEMGRGGCYDLFKN